MDTLALHSGFADLADTLFVEHPALASLAVDSARRTSSDTVLTRVLRAAERCGESDVTAAVERARTARPTRAGRAAALLGHLTPREREVLALMADGLRNRDIVARLVLSESTVKTHVYHIFTKLGGDDAGRGGPALPRRSPSTVTRPRTQPGRRRRYDRGMIPSPLRLATMRSP